MKTNILIIFAEVVQIRTEVNIRYNINFEQKQSTGLCAQ